MKVAPMGLSLLALLTDLFMTTFGEVDLLKTEEDLGHNVLKKETDIFTKVHIIIQHKSMQLLKVYRNIWGAYRQKSPHWWDP